MNSKTRWLLLAASVGAITYLLIRKRKHKRWEKRRAEIIERARRKSQGEFVL
jgi:hypothetical protein